MLRSRFLWKLYAGYVLLILISSSVIGYLAATRIESDSRKETALLLNSQASMLREMALPYIQKSLDSGLQNLLARLGLETGSRFTVIRSDGVVIADSDATPGPMDNHGKRPEILAARATGSGESTRFSNTIQREMMYVALRLDRDAEGNVLGFVRVSLPLDVIDERLHNLRKTVIWGAGLAALLALALGWLVARRITLPVERMTEVVHGLAEGKEVQKVPVDSADEIGRLGEAFNAMAAQLHDRMQTILTNSNKLAAILGSMVEGVIAVDTDDGVLHLNPAARQIIQVGPEECIGKRIWEVTRTREICEALTEALRSNSEVLKEISIVDRPRDRAIKIHASPLKDSEGRLAGAVVLLHDITALRRLETVRRDFVANVSHELKTPLTAVRGLVETMLDDPDIDSETSKRFLEKIHRQAMRLSALVTDLLTLSRVDRETTDLERTVIDLRQPVRESLRTLASSAEAKAITVQASMPEDSVKILGDSEALRQAVDNVLDNAIKYTPEGGRIALELKRNGDQASLSIEDSGPGIDPQHKDRIFERFYRVDKARSRELGGTGLGLSIVKHIAQAHDGEVYLESEPGQGSIFTISLPIIANPS